MIEERTPNPPAANEGLFGWLGFGRNRTHSPAEPQPIDPIGKARTHLLAQIGSFLLDNHLEITPQNLALAHSVFSGLNPGLERRVARLAASGQAITQSWLDQAAATDEIADHEALDRLTKQLELGIDQFSRTTQSARTVTANYGDALKQHVEALDSSPDHGDVVSSLADYARAMLERSRKAEEDLQKAEQETADLRQNLAHARRDAEIDFLTGLPNRRAFEALLETEHRAAQAAIEPLHVAFCDIDHFKAVNDTHGHDAGDRVIKAVADLLSEISHEKCHIARHGGEEFVLLMRGPTQEEAFELLEGAREKMATRKLVNRRTRTPFGQVTFSGGIANVFAFDNPRAALAAADAALYEAKENGRNQVRLAEC